MSVEVSNSSAAKDCASNALTEIRSCRVELQEFMDETFDRLEILADEVLTRELAHQEHLRQAEHQAVDQQVDRLATLAAELAQTVSEQKRLLAKRRRH